MRCHAYVQQDGSKKAELADDDDEAMEDDDKYEEKYVLPNHHLCKFTHAPLLPLRHPTPLRSTRVPFA